jgi:hypothetical protein
MFVELNRYRGGALIQSSPLSVVPDHFLRGNVRKRLFVISRGKAPFQLDALMQLVVAQLAEISCIPQQRSNLLSHILGMSDDFLYCPELMRCKIGEPFCGDWSLTLGA